MGDYEIPQYPKNGKWSDTKCLLIASQESFPAIVRDPKVQKNIISRYLNFYLGGKIQKGLTARDLAFAVISILPISLDSEEFIWTKSEYSDDGKLFFLTPEDKLKYEIDTVVNKRTIFKNEEQSLNDEADAEEEQNINRIDLNKEANNSPDKTYDTDEGADKKSHLIKPFDNHENDMTNNRTSPKCIPFVEDLQWYRLKHDIRTSLIPANEQKYGPVENAAFCIYFNSLLDTWDTNVSSRITLKHFFGLVALFVMRGKAKTFHNLTRYFSTKFNIEFFTEVKCYTAPHKGFVKKSWKTFRESDYRTQIMFAKLVIISLLHPNRLSKYGKNNIIKFAILSHTAYCRMGIINMLQQLASVNNAEFETFFKALYCEETAASWGRVNEFFKKYLNKEAKQHTFHWAGCIESDAFQDLSCSNNFKLAVVVAVFIEKITSNAGVWQSAWVCKGTDLESCKQLGYKIYDDYRAMCSNKLEYELL
ncbi:uncharacterized protein LOC120632319 isoform X2 [Pararge aegeria]|uniref:uncharacterized protein LOC120632319 isoform X2 n=1 Tax=Pararge aegeria TaxID=116150 RepID=UPI0019D096F6|nr:uncharacterized protein LOC120632319 isoform X2 [Pararge aegeria]